MYLSFTLWVNTFPFSSSSAKALKAIRHPETDQLIENRWKRVKKDVLVTVLTRFSHSCSSIRYEPASS